MGPEGEHASDAFDLFVCTPEYLKREGQAATSGRGLLIVQDSDLPRIGAVIEWYLSTLHSADWPAISVRINPVARWAFETHQSGPT
ncbi:Imm8 family immunity protein [uncultured Deinococcus sp.]|uniref:Imm8 family immunity protein n=1 Tax=uncultured Deinococcus sp. TaxID=158789 RepID=UPI00345C1785